MRGRLRSAHVIVPGCFQGNHERTVSTDSNPKDIVKSWIRGNQLKCLPSPDLGSFGTAPAITPVTRRPAK
jgi:hypothetical protein